ncbi:type III pantothenate kinase [Kaarinaea lacus]
MQTYLLVDVGNSRLKWNVWQLGSEQFSRKTQYVTHGEQSIRQLLDDQWGAIEDGIQKVFVANVAGDKVATDIKNWCIDRWGNSPEFATTGPQFKSVKNSYRNYGELGIDRWLAVIAAHQLYHDQTAIVVDCGTAITVDAVTREGQHYAGPIIPGRQMMFQALASSTSDLDHVSENNQSSSIIVDNTQKAIVSGVNFAISSALDTVVSELRQTLIKQNGADRIAIIVTGGAAEAVMALTQIKDFTDEPDLVLTGLRLMATEIQ